MERSLFACSLSGERSICKSVQAAWPGLWSRVPGRWHHRIGKLLADGKDYLSNRDTLATNVRSWKERGWQRLWCCQLVYRKRFGRIETDVKKRYSIISSKEKRRDVAIKLHVDGTSFHAEEPFREPFKPTMLTEHVVILLFYYCWKDHLFATSIVKSTVHFFLFKNIYWGLLLSGFLLHRRSLIGCLRDWEGFLFIDDGMWQLCLGWCSEVLPAKQRQDVGFALVLKSSPHTSCLFPWSWIPCHLWETRKLFCLLWFHWKQ